MLGVQQRCLLRAFLQCFSIRAKLYQQSTALIFQCSSNRCWFSRAFPLLSRLARAIDIKVRSLCRACSAMREILSEANTMQTTEEYGIENSAKRYSKMPTTKDMKRRKKGQQTGAQSNWLVELKSCLSSMEQLTGSLEQLPYQHRTTEWGCGTTG